MGQTIADSFKPGVITGEDIVLSKAMTTSLFDSGLLVKNGTLQTQIDGLSTKGQTVILPEVHEGAFSEANHSDDTSNTGAISTFSRFVRNAWLGAFNKAYATADLVKQWTGSIADVDVAVETSGGYWAKHVIAKLLSQLAGIAGGTGAAGVTLDKSTEDFSANAVIAAEAKFGEDQDSFSYIVVSAEVYGKMKQDNLISYIQPSEGGKPVSMYGNKTVLVSNRVFKDIVGNKVHTILVKAGSIGFAAQNNVIGLEYDRSAGAGNGGGSTTVWARSNYVLDISGWSFKGTNVAGNQPTLAEDADGANWELMGDAVDSSVCILITKIPVL